MENLAIDIDSIPLTKKAPYGLLPAWFRGVFYHGEESTEILITWV